MLPFRFGVVAVALCLCGPLACKEEPQKWEDAEQAAEKKLKQKQERAKALGSAAPKETAGKSFNPFFPETINGASRKFTTEKDGYTEAVYDIDGDEVAKIAVADVHDNETSLKKFTDTADKLGAYPLATFGKRQSMVLVSKRYQVKVMSKTLDHDARKGWLEKFDLAGLAKL